MVKTTQPTTTTTTTTTPTSDDAKQKRINDDNIRFKGVRKRKWGKWVSEIRLPNSRERIWLGSYDTPEKAARAFDAALYCLRGKQAKFNFPQNPPDIQGGTSLKPHEIQVAAANFANQIPSSSSLSQQIDSHNHHFNDFVVPSSPPQSNSDSGGVQTGSDLSVMDWPLLDFSMMTGSESSTPDFGKFGGLDDFAENYLAPELNFDNYDEQEINGGDCSQSSFLWNF
ncbi:hypothetical protein AQUCO_07600039v1 [Aquilegia coerulea]|uniref:AP2/ERF domain-containing protein n=1 Tax=Aquilegia coerulea TaxID=218851 RepID=A0A2G5C8H5_AQUCA|nr:hypothetical protein AQUCO_07600039v1 [Aquilegia coerulea]